jgi:hypothetical protein
VKLAYDFETLAADPGLINVLSQIDFLARFRLDLNQLTLAEVRDLRDELAKRLGREGGNSS